MENIYDILLVLGLKIIVIIIFVYLLRKWFKKTHKVIPIILYWVLGLFFILVLSFTIFDWLYNSFFYKEGDLLRSRQSLQSWASLTSIVIYIIIGLKFFRKKTIQINN